MRRGPHFNPPPRALIASITQRWPTFWRDFTSDLDAVLGDVDGVYVNWFRSAAQNARVGGQLNSQHRWATAVDLVIPRDQKARVIRDLRARHWFVIDEGDHLHAQAFPAGTLERSGIPRGVA